MIKRALAGLGICLMLLSAGFTGAQEYTLIRVGPATSRPSCLDSRIMWFVTDAGTQRWTYCDGTTWADIGLNTSPTYIPPAVLARANHTGAQAESTVTNLVSDLAAKEVAANKNQANGYPGLDGSSKLSGAQQLYGSIANTAAQGNDSRLSDSRAPNGTAGGDLAGTYPNPTIKASVSLATPNINVATGTSLAVTGAITSSGTAGIGYATGAGGTVTQATSKTTGVTLNKLSGTITMNAAALAASTIVTFTISNSAMGASDLPVVVHDSGGTVGAYTVTGNGSAAGSFKITVRNNTAASLSEALVIRFIVVKASVS